MGDTLNIHPGHDLFSTLLESALYLDVHQPTRENNVLNLVVTARESLVHGLNVSSEFSSSDHRMISFKIKNKEDMNINEERTHAYRPADFDTPRYLLAIADWSVTSGASDINKTWEIFTGILDRSVNYAHQSVKHDQQLTGS